MPDDIAKILQEHKAELDAAIDMFNAAEARATKAEAKLKRHQAREAAQGSKLNRAAYDALIKTSRVNPDFADEVFELSGLAAEKGEMELDEMKAKLEPFLEAKPKFLKQEAPAPQPKPKQPPTKSTVEPKPTPKPTEAERIAEAGNRFDYRSSDLSNPDWMLENGDRFAAASMAGQANRIGD